jgi:LemA protein
MSVERIHLKGGSVKAMRAMLAAGALLLFTGCGYNTIQTYDEQVSAAQSQIKVQLQRRADLIPNLVEVVKGYARQEQTIFIEVANARARLSGAVASGDLSQMATANAALTAPLGRLLAIAENYPQLKSNENFRALQDQLEGTENRIAVSRQDYNDAVNRYNAYIRRFPQVLTAKVIGKGPRAYFELQTAGADTVPKVKMN